MAVFFEGTKILRVWNFINEARYSVTSSTNFTDRQEDYTYNDSVPSALKTDMMLQGETGRFSYKHYYTIKSEHMVRRLIVETWCSIWLGSNIKQWSLCFARHTLIYYPKWHFYGKRMDNLTKYNFETCKKVLNIQLIARTESGTK